MGGGGWGCRGWVEGWRWGGGALWEDRQSKSNAASSASRPALPPFRLPSSPRRPWPVPQSPAGGDEFRHETKQPDTGQHTGWKRRDRPSQRQRRRAQSLSLSRKLRVNSYPISEGGNLISVAARSTSRAIVKKITHHSPLLSSGWGDTTTVK